MSLYLQIKLYWLLSYCFYANIVGKISRTFSFISFCSCNMILDILVNENIVKRMPLMMIFVIISSFIAKLKGNFLDIWLLARINFASMHLYTVLNEFKSHYTIERDPNSVPQPDLIITFFITFISSLAISLE